MAEVEIDCPGMGCPSPVLKTKEGCTDVTGFGLLGHTLEMASGSKVTIILIVENIPLLPEVLDSVRMGLVPAGSFSNRNYCAHQIRRPEAIDPVFLDILADAQTSGGLLISLPEDRAPAMLNDLKAGGILNAAVIGRATVADAELIDLR